MVKMDYSKDDFGNYLLNEDGEKMIPEIAMFSFNILCERAVFTTLLSESQLKILHLRETNAERYITPSELYNITKIHYPMSIDKESIWDKIKPFLPITSTNFGLEVLHEFDWILKNNAVDVRPYLNWTHLDKHKETENM